jgi:hypothetical protein
MFACVYSPNLKNYAALVNCAYAFSPLVEETADDTVVLDIEGCELLFGSPREIAEIRAMLRRWGQGQRRRGRNRSRRFTLQVFRRHGLSRERIKAARRFFRSGATLSGSR